MTDLPTAHLLVGSAASLRAKRTLAARVYFIRDGLGHIKIGWTTKGPEARLKSMQSANAGDLELMAVRYGDDAIEEQEHKRWAHLRVSMNREWFYEAPDLVAYIEGHRETWRQEIAHLDNPRSWEIPVASDEECQRHGLTRHGAAVMAAVITLEVEDWRELPRDLRLRPHGECSQCCDGAWGGE